MENQHCGKPLIEIHIICTNKFNMFGLVCASCGHACFNTKVLDMDNNTNHGIFPEKELVEKIKIAFSSNDCHDIHKTIKNTLNNLYHNECKIKIDYPE